jgi:hypothetical protein
MLTKRLIGSALLASLVIVPLTAEEKTVMKQAKGENGAGPKMVLLEDVPWVGFYQGPKKGNPEDHCLPSVMRALMEYVGDDLGLPHFQEQRGKWRWEACALFHGVTGSGFGYSWKLPYGEGHLGRELFRTYERSFAVAGYTCQTLLRSGFAKTQDYDGPVSDDEKEYRRLIVKSIRDQKMPVIAIGVVGPDEPCLITGFKDDGATLLGWNFFLDEVKKDPNADLDEDGKFSKHGWFQDTRGIIVTGRKLDQMPDRRVARFEALCRDLALLCNTGTDDNPLGIAAYQAWIDYLLEPVPEDVAGDPNKIRPLHEKHNAPVGELAERRAYAGTFLSQAVEALPGIADELQQAQHCNQAMHDMLWRVWQTLGVWHRTDDDKLRRFAKPEFRQELAALIRRLQAWDLESAQHIRAALVQFGMTEADLPKLPVLPPVQGLRDLGIEHPLPGKLGRLWETPTPAIPGVPVPGEADLSDAVRAATAATKWAITTPLPPNTDPEAWAAEAGWKVKVVDMPPDETMLAKAQRVNDVILSCLYGLPVATTHDGKPAVIAGYNHLAGEKFRVRLAGQKEHEAPATIKIDDQAWGPTWIFLVGRR